MPSSIKLKLSEKVYPEIDQDIVKYYLSLLKKVNGSEFTYKNELTNKIIDFCIKNPDKFLGLNVDLSTHFNSKLKSVITINLQQENYTPFLAYCLACNRSKKQQAEFILTSYFLLLKSKKINEMYLDNGKIIYYSKKILIKL